MGLSGEAAECESADHANGGDQWATFVDWLCRRSFDWGFVGFDSGKDLLEGVGDDGSLGRNRLSFG